MPLTFCPLGRAAWPRPGGSPKGQPRSRTLVSALRGRGLRILLEGLVVLCAVSVGLPAAPVRAAAWNPARDLPVSLALGPQLHWGRGPQDALVPGGTISAAAALTPRAAGWRWRRAATPFPRPEDVESVPPAAASGRYAVQEEDVGQFLSACVRLRAAPDIASWYCTDFIGPVPDVLLEGTPLTQPLDLLPWPGGGWAVAERAGRVHLYRAGQAPRVLLDLTEDVGNLRDENGLYSLALDPRFPAAPFLYVAHTFRPAANSERQGLRVARFPLAAGRIRRQDELVILETAPKPQIVHFGGALRFGLDGLLYLSVGDGGQHPAEAQWLDTWSGKILRLDVRQATRDQPYRIPADNPLRGRPDARPEIYAWGFRNPWRMAFDPLNGALWVSDVGTGWLSAAEEVNRVRAGTNYGWDLMEGDHCLVWEVCAALNLAPPLFSYGHIPLGGCAAIVGGVVYRGTAQPWLVGSYLFGDFCRGHVWALMPDASGRWRPRTLLRLPVGQFLLSFAVDGRGEVLLLQQQGPLLRLTPPPGIRQGHAE